MKKIEVIRALARLQADMELAVLDVCDEEFDIKPNDIDDRIGIIQETIDILKDIHAEEI